MNKNTGFIVGLGLAALLSTSAFAETPSVAPRNPEVHQLRKQIREDKRQLRKDRHSGAPESQIQADREKLHQDKKERRELIAKRTKAHQEQAPGQ